MAESVENIAKSAFSSEKIELSLLYAHSGLMESARTIEKHSHGSWQADLITEGSAIFVDASGEKTFISKNELVLIPPEKEHYFIYRGGTVKWMSFWFSMKGLDDWMSPRRLPSTEISTGLFACLDMILAAPSFSAGSRHGDAAADCLAALFSILLADELAVPAQASGLASKAMSLIQRSRGGRISVKELCELLNCSKSYLSHEFRRSTGISLKNYIDRHRAEILEQVLEQAELSPAQIAESMGFRDSCELSRFCKRMLGRSPRIFRSTL